MSVVFYKFKSAKDYDTCTFDGPHITVFDLKREILTAKKLGKGTDFDLAVYNAQTNEEFKDDMYHVPRNTSILVSRQPAIKPGKGTAQRYLASAMPTAAMTGGSRVVSTPMGAFSQASAAGMGVKHHSLNNRAPVQRTTDGPGGGGSSAGGGPGGGGPAADGMGGLAPGEITGETEEERIANMFKLQTEQWDHAQDRMAMQKPIYRPYGGTRGSWRGRGGGAAGADQSSTNPDSTSSNGPNNHEHPQGGGGWHHHQQYPAKAPPPGYICYRCGQKGHFINQCPTIGDQTFDRPKLRRTTGIPKIFLKVVDDKTAAGGGVMVTQSGELVIAQPNDQAWADVAARNKNYIDAGDVYEMAPVPDELACPICKKLLRDAVLIPCCGTSYCDECIRTHLLDNEDPAQRLKCPNCHSDQSPDHLIPNKSLRQAVELHIKEFASARRSANSSTAKAATASPQVPAGRPPGDASAVAGSSQAPATKPASVAAANTTPAVTATNATTTTATPTSALPIIQRKPAAEKPYKIISKPATTPAGSPAATTANTNAAAPNNAQALLSASTGQEKEKPYKVVGPGPAAGRHASPGGHDGGAIRRMDGTARRNSSSSSHNPRDRQQDDSWGQSPILSRGHPQHQQPYPPHPFADYEPGWDALPPHMRGGYGMYPPPMNMPYPPHPNAWPDYPPQQRGGYPMDPMMMPHHMGMGMHQHPQHQMQQQQQRRRPMGGQQQQQRPQANTALPPIPPPLNMGMQQRAYGGGGGGYGAMRKRSRAEEDVIDVMAKVARRH